MKALEDNFVEMLLSSRPAKHAVERRLAEMALGIVVGMREKAITPEQAYSDLFNVNTYQAISRHRMNKDLVKLFEWGMELEDVAEVAPQGMEKSFREIEKLAHRILAAG